MHEKIKERGRGSILFQSKGKKVRDEEEYSFVSK